MVLEPCADVTCVTGSNGVHTALCGSLSGHSEARSELAGSSCPAEDTTLAGLGCGHGLYSERECHCLVVPVSLDMTSLLCNALMRVYIVSATCRSAHCALCTASACSLLRHGTPCAETACMVQTCRLWHTHAPACHCADIVQRSNAHDMTELIDVELARGQHAQ